MADSDRATLLKSLKIERSNEHAQAASSAENAMLSRVWLPGLLGLGAGLAIATLAWWFFVPKSSDEQARPSAQNVAPAQSAPQTQPAGGLIASGYVVARRRATIASEVIGRLVSVSVEEGQRVEEGQILARLDDTLAQADLANSLARAKTASANIVALEAQLADAQRILERSQALVKDGFATTASLTRNQANVEALEAQLTAARAELGSTQASVQRARAFLDRHTIRAPYSGIVVDKSAQPGEIISPSSAGGGFTRTGICTIVDMRSLEIEVDVNEAFIARVSPNQSVAAVLDAYPDTRFPGRVIATIPTANRDRATVRVRISLETRDARILPEMAVKVTFLEQR